MVEELLMVVLVLMTAFLIEMMVGLKVLRIWPIWVLENPSFGFNSNADECG